MTTLRASVALLALLAVPAQAASTKPAGHAPAQHAAHRASAHGVLPWIADDYAKAVETARARKVPIFVEIWAPW